MSDALDEEIEGFLRAHGPFEPPPMFTCGERVGAWKVLAFLGRGGSAEVYRAENVVTGIVGALKVLFRSDNRSRERFRRETRLLAETKSSAFPMFYGAGECDEHFYIAEELLEPVVLPADDANVARFVLGVAAGIGELHRRGFIHRDLKPRNILVRPSTGESVLIDMGLAKERGDNPQTCNETTSVVDGRAVGVGTPGFSAPEQFTGGRVSEAVDIHALGVLVNACFNGTPPKAWAAIIRRSTSSIPEQRYATVAEFTRAVRRRHALRWWIAAAILVVLVAAAVVVGIGNVGRAGTPCPPQVRESAVAGRPPNLSGVAQRSPIANEPSTPAERELVDAILEATYDQNEMAILGASGTNEYIKIDKKSALDAMRKGILPWF